MKQTTIKLSVPHLGGKEGEYTADAVASTWITPLGPYVDRFEQALQSYLNVDNVVALSSGTAAIHLALADLGVTQGDYVICQSMTFAATANPIVYLGAKPVFVDSEDSTWNMSPSLLEEAIRSLSVRPKAILVVDLYGMPARHDEIRQVAMRYGVPVIEDAAEALGSVYSGRFCGDIYGYGTLSFNGNKMITTSGGGALICPDSDSASHVKHLATQARENRPYYYHTEIGYNYRLSNVSAAIGCAQMEVLQQRIDRRRAICNLYNDLLRDLDMVDVHLNPDRRFQSNYWLTTILINDKAPSDATPEALRLYLLEQGIETRRLWRPMHMQPVFESCEAFADSTSERLFNQGLCLPSSSILTDNEIRQVADCIISFFKK